MKTALASRGTRSVFCPRVRPVGLLPESGVIPLHRLAVGTADKTSHGVSVPRAHPADVGDRSVWAPCSLAPRFPYF